MRFRSLLPRAFRVGDCGVENTPDSVQHGLSVFFSYASRNGLVERCEIWTDFSPLDGLCKLLYDKMMDHVIEALSCVDSRRSLSGISIFLCSASVTAVLFARRWRHRVHIREELDDNGSRFDDDKHRRNKHKGDGGGGLLLDQVVEDSQSGEQTVRFL